MDGLLARADNFFFPLLAAWSLVPFFTFPDPQQSREAIV